MVNSRERLMNVDDGDSRSIEERNDRRNVVLNLGRYVFDDRSWSFVLDEDH